jgi:hypothetical protein
MTPPFAQPPPVGFPNNTSDLAILVPYSIKIEGEEPQRCHCAYVDSGSISADLTFRNGNHLTTSKVFNNDWTDIPCEDGHDSPGVVVGLNPQGSFGATYTMDYRWFGTLICIDSDNAVTTDNAWMFQTFTGSSQWPPPK